MMTQAMHVVQPDSRAATSAAAVLPESGSFPWPLFILSCPMLYWLHNEIDAPSHPYEAQSLTDIVQGAETGNVVARIIIVALAAVGTFLVVRYRRRLRMASWIAPIALAFMLWVLMTGLWSTDFSLSMRRLISLVFLTIFSAGCALRMNARALLLFFASIPILSLIPGVLAELHYGTFQPWISGYRFGGTAPHPNVEGATLAMTCLLLCWHSWRARGAARKGGLLALFIAASFLLLTGSRTAVIAMLVAMAYSIVLVLLRDYRRTLPLVFAFILLVTGLGGLFSMLSTNSIETHSRSAIEAERDGGSGNTLNGRVDLWRSLLAYANKRPWGGYGYGSFWTPRRIEVVSADQGWVIQQSHSAYLDELLAVGIPGAVLYISVLVACLIQSSRLFWQQRDGYGAWSSVFLLILAHNMTESININPGFTYLVFSTLVLHVCFVELDPPSQANEESLGTHSRPALLDAQGMPPTFTQTYGLHRTGRD